MLIAILSNLAFKLVLAASMGSRAFARKLGTLGAVALVAGVSVLLFW